MSIGVKVDDHDLVLTAVDDFPSYWETFMAAVNGREIQPSFDRSWHDCLEEEGRIKSRIGPPTENDHALAAKTKKGKRFPHHKDKGKVPPAKQYVKGKVL